MRVGVRLPVEDGVEEDGGCLAVGLARWDLVEVTVKTAAFAGVAGRPGRDAHVDERVAVAVDAHGGDVEHVAARLALLPEPLPTAAEEPGLAARKRTLDRLAVGVADHQDLARGVVLDHDRQQASGVVCQVRGRHYVSHERQPP